MLLLRKISPGTRRKANSVADFTNNNTLFIHVINTRTEQAEPPIKENAEFHGIGLTIIQQVADKYGGHLKVNVSSNQFEITVVLPFMTPRKFPCLKMPLLP
jgi:sensor histidine kinase regulating citrate/malate metabolism